MNDGYMTLKEFTQLDLYKEIEPLPRQKGKRQKNRKQLFDVTCAFDIETSTVYIDEQPHSFLYVWQFQFGEQYTVLGRTWLEFIQLLKFLKVQQFKWMKSKRRKLDRPIFVCYVHNLAYEWQFLQGIFRFQNEDCFFRDARKPIYARLFNLVEFRCSYLHSNMALSKFGENMGATVRKLDGRKFDYAKVRYPWTPLTEYEIQYCINDVKTLVESLNLEMKRDCDNLVTLPLTSTGYVRRDLKEAIKPMYYKIQTLNPDYECYKLLRRCFRGGDTHANRYHVGTVQGAGGSVDIESSYPYTLAVDLYPMSAFWKLEDTENMMERIIKLIRAGNAVIADYHIKGLRLRDDKDPIPYLPVAKCHPYNYVEDNGRILSADLCTVALTEIDLMIVLDQYDYTTISAHNVHTALKAQLPQPYRDVVLKYYQTKTQLKKVAGREYEYMKSKNKLNSCYGMAAQQSIHPVITYNNEPLSEEPYNIQMPEGEAAETELMKAPFPYQWGVYCTAYARRNLRRGMKCIPKDEKTGISRILYCDTDSIKYLGERVDFSKLNAQIEKVSRQNGATAYNSKHEFHYMGKWDEEPRFTSFITQGAKRYAYTDTDDKLHVVVSGVTDKPITEKDLETHPDLSPEDVGKQWKVHELGNLDNFREGMIWQQAGGTAAVYNDTDNFYYADPDTGKVVRISPNVSIIDTTYEMTLEPDFKDVLDGVALYLRFCEERGREMK